MRGFGEKAAVFNYGFLSVKISKLMAQILTNRSYELMDDNKASVEQAKLFLTNIINGQKLISGERGGYTPSSESVEAVGYALRTLEVLQHNEQINTMQELSEIKEAFETIYSVVNDVSINNSNAIKEVDLNLTSEFFSWLSSELVSDAQKISRVIPF